jgi:hypothetical protein
MGNAGSGGNPRRNKLEDYEFVQQLSETKRLMRSKLTQKLSVVIERTFACE